MRSSAPHGDRRRQLDQVRGAARRDGRLATRIVSIDPEPRGEVDTQCDRVLHLPLEAADASVFGRERLLASAPG
jgi:hypothetical protein